VTTTHAAIKPTDQSGGRSPIAMILAAFKAHPQYRRYHQLVCFLFGTGCRFGEAAGLRWWNVADDFSHIIFCEAISRDERSAIAISVTSRMAQPSNS
jgi:integrase